MAIICFFKEQKIKVGEDVEKLEIVQCTAGTAAVENSMVLLSKINQNYCMIQQVHFRYLPKNVFHTLGSQRCISYIDDEWINKIWHIHITEYSISLKRNQF
jgi:hypothetical protein